MTGINWLVSLVDSCEFGDSSLDLQRLLGRVYATVRVNQHDVEDIMKCGISSKKKQACKAPINAIPPAARQGRRYGYVRQKG